VASETKSPEDVIAALRDPDRVRPVEMHHVNFKTKRLEEMKRFYATLLEAEVMYENPMVAFLTYDEGHHRIALLGNPDLEDADRGAEGFEHVAFLYRSLDDLLATWERLRGLGIEPFWTTNHGPSISFYYRDPDGNSHELQADRFATFDDAVEWFETGDFDRNPIGVDVSPQRLVDLRAEGVSEAELFERSRSEELM
jgi:catechol-2,3-dioxygenase